MLWGFLCSELTVSFLVVSESLPSNRKDAALHHKEISQPIVVITLVFLSLDSLYTNTDMHTLYPPVLAHPVPVTVKEDLVSD